MRTAQPFAFVSVEGCVEAAWPAATVTAELTPSVVVGMTKCIPPNPAAAAATIVAGSFAEFNGVMTAVGFNAVPGAAEVEAAAAAATGAAAKGPSFRGGGGRGLVWK